MRTACEKWALDQAEQAISDAISRLRDVESLFPEKARMWREQLEVMVEYVHEKWEDKP